MAMNMLRTKALQQVSKNSNKTLVKAMSSSSTPYTERQARLGRPVSPHVTIYKFPVNALTSITNRVTGVGLAGGIAAGSAVAFVGGDVPSIIYSLQDIVPGFAPLSKFFVAFPFTYHFLSAVRHVAWDIAPELITNEQAPKMSYALVGAASAISLGAAAYTIKTPEKKD